MKNQPPDPRADYERRLEDAKKNHVAPEPTKDGAHGRPVSGGAPETPESRATFPERTRKPGKAGLANEARPGLGTRADDADAAAARAERPLPEASGNDGGQPKVTERTYEEPRPEPREQPADSLEHEQERSTGVSGHSGNT